MKRTYIFIFLFLLVVFFIGITQTEPLLKKIILSKIETISHQNKINIQWKTLNINKTLLKIQLKDVQLKYSSNDEITYFEEISLQLNPLRSITRQQIIFDVFISNFQFHFDVSQHINNLFSKKNISNPLKFIQKIRTKNITPKIQLKISSFSSLPIHKIKLFKGNFYLKTGYEPIVLEDSRILIQNRSSSIQFKVDALMKINELNFQTQSQFILKDNMVDIKNFNLNNEHSDIAVSGYFLNSSKKSDSFLLNSKIQLSWNDVNLWIKYFNIDKNFSGRGENFFASNFQITYSKDKGLEGPFDIELNNFKRKNINFSQIKMKGRIHKNSTHFSMIHFEKKDQTFFFDNTQINFDKNFSFKTKIYSYIQNFQSIRTILKLDPDIHFSGPSELLCSGQIIDPQFQCSVDIFMENFSFLIKKSPVFVIPKIKFSSQLLWNSKEFSSEGSFKTDRKSKFQFTFLKKRNKHTKISFNGDINLSKVSSFSERNIDGKINFKNGKIQIDSQKNILASSNLKAEKFSFSKIHFGNFQTNMTWDRKKINFNNIIGKLNKSKYKAYLYFDFSQSSPLWTAWSDFSPFYLEDLSKSIQSYSSVSMFGQGKAQFSAKNSPLQSNRWSYQFQSSFKNIKIYDESFKELIFNINSNKGKVSFNNILAKKIKGNIQVKGNLSPNKIFRSKIIAENLEIEKSENFKKWMNPYVSGLLFFDLNLTGSIKNPTASVTSRLTNLSYGSTLFKDSNLEFQIHSNSIQGKGDFFGKQLIVKNFKLTNLKKDPEFFAQFKSKDWNFIPFIQSIDPALKIFSKMTGQASIHFPLKKFSFLSGSINFENVSFRHESNQFQSSHPFHVQLDSGAFHFQGSSLKWKTNNKPVILKKINQNKTSISGLVRLEFLHAFLPFINNIQGEMLTDFNINNDLKKFSPKGTIKIENAILDFTDSFNIFQSFNLDGYLDSNRLEIKNFNAQTAEGKIYGKGKIDFSYKDLLPVDIQTYWNQINFRISDEIKMKGYGSLRYHGNKKPYFLSGLFHIEEGHYAREFSQKKQNNIGSLSSKWMTSEKKENPFYLDISLNMKNPFVIENSLMSALLDGSIYLKGDYKLPLVEGDLNFIPGGKFYVREYDFEMTTGQILYNKDRIDNPYMNLIGQTEFEEIQYNQNTEIINRYNIRAEVQGYKNDFQLRLSSQPSLSEQEILSMMALGSRSVEFINSSQLSNAAQYSYSSIGYALFRNMISRGLTNLFGIRFSITPHINKNTNKIATKVWFHKKWYKNLNTSISTFIEDKDSNNNSFNVEYNLTPKISLLGMWRENKKPQGEQNESSILSLDVEYKWNF